MRLFTKKNSSAARRAAIGFSERGVGLVAVGRDGDAPPTLEACEFAAADGPEDWGRVLGELARRHRLGHCQCSIVIEQETYTLLLVEAPDVPPEERRAALRWRVQDLIDFHVDDAVIDVFDVPEHRSGARARMMYVVAARRSAVGLRTELAHDAGLDLRVVDIVELAQRNVAAGLPEDVAGVALLQLTESSGLVTLTRQGVLYLARRVDSGLDELHLAAAQGAGPQHPAARQWMDGLVVEVQRSLDYYERSFAQPPIGHVVIAPLSQPVPGLAEHLSEQLGVQARELGFAGLLDCQQVPEIADAARCFPALGAALREESVAA
jgi:MSHA biogenesis protein MshI